MSGMPVSGGAHPPHGHPENQAPSTQSADRASTSSHPHPTKPDPTTAGNNDGQASHALSTHLTRQKASLRAALGRYPDFPSPGVLFEDIMPLFASPSLHAQLIDALEAQVRAAFPTATPDVVVGLESRGFLFGPSLALRLGAGFVPIRKKGKLPGATETEEYQKEYGSDFFQIQKTAFEKGKTVLVVDDIIATGGSAAAAGSLVKKIGGRLMGYLFIMELEFLHGRDKLEGEIVTLLTGQDEEDRSLIQGAQEGAEPKSVQDAGGAAAEQRP